MKFHEVQSPEDESLWEQVVEMEGCPFFTSRGLGFTYHIKRSRDGSLLGEILFDRRGKSITRATLLLAYQNALKVQKHEGCVSGPKKLGVFGASYLYPIFLRLGICTRTPGEKNIQQEETAMPRPKGSKNRKKLVPAENLDALIAQKQEENAALEAQRDEVAAVVAEHTANLKAIKAELKKADRELAGLEAQKAAVEAAAAAAAAKEAVQAKIDELMAQGKSLEDIMNLLG